MNCLNMSELFKKQALNMSPDFNICESIDIVHGMWMHWIKLQQNQLTTVLHCWVPARIKGQTEKSTTTRLVTCLCMKAYLAANFSYIADNFGSQSMRSSGEDTVHSKCDINILYIYIYYVLCVYAYLEASCTAWFQQMLQATWKSIEDAFHVWFPDGFANCFTVGARICRLVLGCG